MSISEENKIVHGLWIGRSLATLELLTIKSFMDHGHEFHLWVYDELETTLPVGVKLEDANTVIPREKIFRYKNKDQYGHGKGSLAGFSDIFRYKLLYKHGGWWVDMDVTCLKPLDFIAPYVFRPHHDMPVVGNVMKCPKGCDLMNYCFERASVEVDENNRDWHLPIQILNDGIERFGLSKYIVTITNPESWYENRNLVLKNIVLPGHWYAIHWINEEWRRNGINKNYSGKNSVLRQLFVRHGLPVSQLSWMQQMVCSFRLSFPLSMALKSPWAFRYAFITIIYRVGHSIKSILKKYG
jgi:hypothetical protein